MAYAIISLLSCAIAYILWQQHKDNQQHFTKEQNHKVLLALLAYPVHQYPLTHLLERCIAILFSVEHLALAQKGAIFLVQNNQLSFTTHRGLDNDAIIHCSTIDFEQCQCGTSAQLKQLTYTPYNKQTCHLYCDPKQEHGHYSIPLVKQDTLLGIMLLCTHKTHKSTPDEITSLKAIANCIASLIERKYIADESALGFNIFTHSQQAIIIADAQQSITRVNKPCEEMTGYTAQELIGKTPRLLQSVYQSKSFYKKFWHTINTTGSWQGEIPNMRKDGSIYPSWLSLSSIKDHKGNIVQYLAIFSDLSSIKKARQDINQLSFFDPLTKLPNKILFNDRLNHAIAQANRYQQRIAILYLDINHFKKVNDSLGHDYGDILLKEIALRLQSTLHDGDTIARVGNDEFVILIQDTGALKQSKATHIADKILAVIEKPLKLQKHEIQPSCSMGIAFFPHDAVNAADLIKHANIAMHQAKKADHNHYHFFTEQLNQDALRRLKIESALQVALDQAKLEVFLQPQINLNDLSLSGAEGLLRWHDPDMGYISPAEFIPIAEDSDLISKISDWVFYKICQQIKYWDDRHLFPAYFGRIAINISPKQFKRDNFITRLQEIITNTQVPVQYLEIELTESSLQQSSQSVLNKLTAIKQMGIHIAIDDFGTGYSSLSRLKQFPIDLLKIDRSFIINISHNESDKAIVQAIIGMSNALGIKTLSEGVENIEQLKTLQTLNCHYYQGFYYSKAINFSSFEKLLSRHA